MLLALGSVAALRMYAQSAEGGTGRIEVGARAIFGDHDSSKFNEYRHLPQGLFLRSSEFSLDDLFHGRFYVRFQSRDSFQRDQAYLLTAGQDRKYRLQVRWDETPHVFTNTARSFLIESGPGQFTAPASVISTLRQPANLGGLLDGAPVVNMSLRRHGGSAVFTYTPTANWTFDLGYTLETQLGHRPFGTTANQFTNIVELPEPIDYRTHQVRVGAEYATNRWGFQTGYSASLFHNAVSTLTWDIPFLSKDAQGAAAHGRLALYPDNFAQSATFAGAVNVSSSNRLTASVAPGWMRQNEPFLPYTINSAINTGAPFQNPCPAGIGITDVQCLPARSLHGSKQTMAMNYQFTSDAIRGLPLTVRYRSYDYNNDTPSIIFNDWVKSDTQLVGTARRSMPFDYARKTLSLDAGKHFGKNSSADLFYEWERMDREHREVEHSHENTVGASLDLNPREWLNLKTSYRRSYRRPQHYEIDEETWPFGEGPETDPNGAILAVGGPGPGLGQIEELRKFDQAARNRHRGEVLLQISPWEKASFDASFGTTQDDYFHSEYGLQKDVNFNYSLDFTYNLHPAVSLFGEGTRETYHYRQRSRQRTPANPTRVAVDSPNSDWISNSHDLIHTIAGGLDGSAMRRVKWTVFYTLSIANGQVHTRALGDPRLPGFLPTTAENYPNTSNRWHQVIASAKLPLTRAFAPKIEYRFERYDRMDFQMTNAGRYYTLDPSTAAAVFLRADVPGYNAHMLAISFEYRF